MLYDDSKTQDRNTDQLNHNNLICLTDQVKPKERHNIDHICVSYKLQPYCQVGFWENISDSNVTMSDHNGVFVDVELQAYSPRA